MKAKLPVSFSDISAATVATDCAYTPRLCAGPGPTVAGWQCALFSQLCINWACRIL